MTRRNQVLRSWITRDSTKSIWKSHVSFQGKHHIHSTGTQHRRAALEYAQLHTLAILTSRPAPPIAKPQQSDLFQALPS